MNCVKPVFKVIIPHKWLETQMLPATKTVSKRLLPIYDRPITDHVDKEAIGGGIREIISETRSGKDAIENHLEVH